MGYSCRDLVVLVERVHAVVAVATDDERHTLADIRQGVRDAEARDGGAETWARAEAQIRARFPEAALQLDEYVSTGCDIGHHPMMGAARPIYMMLGMLEERQRKLAKQRQKRLRRKK